MILIKRICLAQVMRSNHALAAELHSAKVEMQTQSDDGTHPKAHWSTLFKEPREELMSESRGSNGPPPPTAVDKTLATELVTAKRQYRSMVEEMQAAGGASGPTPLALEESNARLQNLEAQALRALTAFKYKGEHVAEQRAEMAARKHDAYERQEERVAMLIKQREERKKEEAEAHDIALAESQSLEAAADTTMAAATATEEASSAAASSAVVGS